MIPCSYDDVIFPKDNLFYVNVERDTEINVKTLKITGKVRQRNFFYLNEYYQINRKQAAL